MGLFDFFKKKKKKATEPSAATKQFYTLKIDKVVKETPDAISVYLHIPSKLKSAYAYQAGQYVTLRVDLNGKQYLRSYSLSSSPQVDDYHRIAIKRKPGGAVSGFLCDNLMAGKELNAFTPLGTFTPDLNNTTPNYFLYAGGSGITPMISIAKTLLSQATDSNVQIIYANRNAESIIYKKELEQLATQYGRRFQMVHILDQKTADFNGLQGIFKAADYAAFLKDQFDGRYANAHHFVCGPTPMMQAVENGLKQLDIAKNKVHIEYFEIEKQPNQGEIAQITKPASKSSDNAKGGATATVIVDKKTHTVTVPKGTKVLDAVLDAGIDAPFMCQEGVCSSCRAKLTDGKAKMAACYSLSDKEQADGFVLTCQLIPETDEITVNYDV